MPLLHKVARSLTKHPKLKRSLKDAYQNIGNLISNKKSYPELIKCISGNETEYEHLFGYYDKSPWNSDGSKMIYLRVNGATKQTASTDPADIILNDLRAGKEEIIAQTSSWNVQQGCMLQWLGPEFTERIIYNDFRNRIHCSVILDITTGEEQILPMPVYSVSRDGTTALMLDFSRLNSFRPGYGYSNLEDKSSNIKCPDTPCIWRMEINTGDIRPLFSYRFLYDYNTRLNMEDAYHKVNHIMINPSGDRFMFLHRWILNGVKYDRLITCDVTGRDFCTLLDDDMVSHCNWKNDGTIIAWANTHAYGQNYYELVDKTNDLRVFAGDVLKVDGHPSYSPDGKYLITDTYPDFKRKQSLFLCDLETEKVIRVAEVYSNILYKNECRCDLHPRWKRDSSEVCFDGALGGRRQVYTLCIADVLNA